MRFPCLLKLCSHFCHDLRKLLRVIRETLDKSAEIESPRQAEEHTMRIRERRPARTASRRNGVWQMHCIRAATPKRFMRVLHQPDAVAAVENQVCGYCGPLASIRSRGRLAIPRPCLGDANSGIGHAVPRMSEF